MTGFLTRNRMVAAVVALLVVVLAATTAALRDLPDPVVEGLVGLSYQAGQRAEDFDEDGLFVITTGTGAPLPDENRAGPQTVVRVGDVVLAFDAGPGSTRSLETTVGNASHVEALFLTHFHSDHIGDIGELMLKRWASSGRVSPLPIYGPPGVEEVVSGFEAAYALDVGYRVDHHGEDVMPPSGAGAEVRPFDLGPELGSSAVVYDEGGIQVTAFNVNHSPVSPAVGYRVDYGGRSVVISGDLVYDDTLVAHAMGADLFISEALNATISQMISDVSAGDSTNASPVASDIQDYHITPEQAGVVARDAGMDMLLVTHVLPPVPHALESTFLAPARDVYDGPVRMASDGTRVFLPSGSDDLIVSELGR